MSLWPDDEFNAKKPRYSAGTGSRLLVNKQLDLENTRNELVKVSDQLDAVTRDRDETTIKLRDEMSRLTAVEELLRRRTEELNQEKLSRANLETELETTSAKCKELDKDRKGVEQQLNDVVSRQDAGDQRSKIASLERKLRALQAENASLSAPARPSSRTSSIPVPSSRRPRSSSENRSPRLEEDLKTCRAELLETKEKLKKAEAKIRQTEETTIRLENEKTALDRKAKATKADLDNSLQEAKEEIDILQLQLKSVSNQSGSTTEFKELSKAYAGSQEQLQAALTDKQDLEKRLARKAAQCETLQEKLDGCMYPSSDEEGLRQQLADAQEELARTKRQFNALKREVESTTDRRDSLLRTRYELQDRNLQVQSLEEKLRRRESSTAALEAQEEQTMRFFNEREAAKDKLQQAETRARYLESQLQFRQQELNEAKSQIKDLEQSLTKSRTFNAQQQELYNEAVKSCTIAEQRATEVERELFELRDEMANRSTTEEAAERNRQWALALERVNELERARNEDRAPTPTPRAPAIPLPPVASFSDQADMDAVASLFVTLQRIREERDTLRGSVEFLTFELRAKESAVEKRLEVQHSSSLQLLRSAEDDVALLRQDLTTCEARLLQSQEESRTALKECALHLGRTKTMAMATFVALQHANAVQEANATSLEGSLERDQNAAAEQVQELQADLGERDRVITDLNTRCSEATQSLRDATRDLHALQEKFSDLEEVRAKLEATLDEETAHYRDLERDNSTQAIAYQRLEETHNILREELYEARMEADQLRNDHMNTLANESPDAQSALQGHIDELDARIMRRNEQIGAQQNDIRRLDMNLKIAEAAVDEMRMELGELRGQNISLEEDAATVRQERNLAERELENARAELDTLRVSLDKQESLFHESEAGREQEVATLVEVISNHGLQIRQVSKYLEETQAEIYDLQARLAEHHNVDDSRSISDDQREELENLKQIIAELSARREEDSGLTSEYVRKAENLEQQLQEAKERGDALATQLCRSDQLARDEVSTRINDLEEQIDSLSTEVETLEERLAEGQQHVQIVLKQNGDLENQLGELEAAASTTSREHKSKVEDLEAQIKSLNEELDGEHHSNQAEHDRLLQELESLQEEYEAAREICKELDETKARALTLQAEGQALSTQLEQVSLDLQTQKLEKAELLQQVSVVEDLRVTVQSQEARLQVAQTARVQAELDLASVKANLGDLRKAMDERSIALEQCRNELAQASFQLEAMPQLQLRISALEADARRMKGELHEAQQAASAAASTTVRDADANVRMVQLETLLATMREENEELERVLTHKTKEIDDHDDRHIEMLKERKKLVAKVDSLNRKIRNMQKQLDAATGVTHADVLPSSEAELGTSLGSSAHVLTPMERPTPRSHSTPEIIRSKSAFEMGQTFTPLVPTSNGPRRSDPSLASITAERANSTPKPLSSSAPPVPMMVATPSSALNLVPTSTSHTPPTRIEVSPPAPTSSSRKRRLPEDFDPSPEEQLPAMPVLSTTPARLRKALQEGPAIRTGFTPSRSRKSSAAAPDKELATAAAAAVASLNLAGTLKPDPFSAALPVKSQPIQPPRATFAELDLGLPRAKPPSDITNTGKINRPPSASSLYAGTAVKSDLKSDPTAPSAPRARGGWLSAARNGTGATRTTGASQALANAAARRAARGLPSSPKLGSGVMPRRQYGDIKPFPRDLS